MIGGVNKDQACWKHSPKTEEVETRKKHVFRGNGNAGVGVGLTETCLLAVMTNSCFLVSR